MPHQRIQRRRVDLVSGSFTGLPNGFNTSLNPILLDRLGAFWSTGENSYGQLGNKTTISNPNFVSPFGTALIWKWLSTGSLRVLAIDKANGTGWSWGYNGNGELGDNSKAAKSTPTSIVGNISWSQIISGNGEFTLGIRGSDGTGWAWGVNTAGMLGDNTTIARSSPVSVVGGLSFIDIAASFTSGAAIEGSTGLAWTWGANNAYQLGDGTNVVKSTPISVLGGNSYIQIVAGSQHILALRGSDGIVFGWGANGRGGVGDGTAGGSKSSPVSVVGGNSYIKIAAGYSSSAAIKHDYTVWTWGENLTGKLGFQPESTSFPYLVITNKIFNKIETGASVTLAIQASDGTAWAWGSNNIGRLGDGTTTNRATPTAVLGGNSYVRISAYNHCLAIRGSDGTLWGWGNNGNGRIGDGTATNRSSPVSVLGGKSWLEVGVASASSVAIDGSDGSAWCWGVNTYGQLGDNTTTQQTSPVSVVGAISFSKIFAGSNHVGGINGSDGSAWCWGFNTSGQLGNSTTTNASSPVSVVGGISFIKLSAGVDFTLGLRGSDGSIWGWGFNTSGQLGNNSVTNVSSPVSVLGGHSFVDVWAGASFAAGKLLDGTILTWGSNSFGQLGNDSKTGRSSPISVVGGHTFNLMALGAFSNYMLGIKSDGSVYFWGNGPYGSWGNNVTGADLSSSPVTPIDNKSMKDLFFCADQLWGLEQGTGKVYWMGRDFNSYNVYWTWQALGNKFPRRGI